MFLWGERGWRPREMQRQRERYHWGRGWNDASTSQGTPRNGSSQKLREELGRDPLLSPKKELTLLTPEPWKKMCFCCSKPLIWASLLYGSPEKLIPLTPFKKQVFLNMIFWNPSYFCQFLRLLIILFYVWFFLLGHTVPDYGWSFYFQPRSLLWGVRYSDI